MQSTSKLEALEQSIEGSKGPKKDRVSKQLKSLQQVQTKYSSVLCYNLILIPENEAAGGTASVPARSTNHSTKQRTFTGNITSHYIIVMIVFMNVQIPPSHPHKQDSGTCMAHIIINWRLILKGLLFIRPQ